MITKQIFIFLVSLISFCSYGQNLFFIGQNSYQCTEPIILISNKEDSENLEMYFAKDNSSKYIAISQKQDLDSEFIENLVLYLDDGEVVTCKNIIASDYVDDIAKAVFELDSKGLNKLRKSSINTVRFTMLVIGYKTIRRSASNNTKQKVNFPQVVEEFFGQ